MLGSRQLGVVGVDLKSAYDSVWSAGLVSRMIQLGVPSYLIRWVTSFLDSRSAKVTVAEGASVWALSRGVPQGSPLSAILFLVFINYLIILLQSLNGVSAQGFADDLPTWWLDTLHTASPHIGHQISQTIQSWAL